MKPGLTYTSKSTVDEANTAAALGSGDLLVFATPAMIALMENAAMRAVAPALEEGATSVGTMMNVVHRRATPVGAQVEATAVLREVDGRRLIFHVAASDSQGLIGEGVHERVVVSVARFMEKVSRAD